MTRRASWLALAWLGLLSAPGQARVLFSPDGDGVKDRAVFRIQVGAQENLAEWRFEIITAEGKPLATFSGPGAPPGALEWDGKDLTGRLVADGAYQYVLRIVTKSGVRSRAPAQDLIVDRVKPVVFSSVTPQLFSPNADGVKDEAVFTLGATDTTGIHSWVLEIKDKEGLVVKQFAGEGAPQAAIVWDGRGGFETDVPDGTYTYTLTAQDLAGNSATTPAAPVSINRQAVVSRLEATPRIFSPNGDGVKDELLIAAHSAAPDSVESWQIQILNKNGKPVAEFSGRGPAPLRLVWSGKTEQGQPHPDGPYHLLLVETDRAGNRARTSPQVCELDTIPPALAARLEPAGLSPNGDGVQDEGVFLVKVTDEHTIEAWSLQVYNDVGVAVRQFQGTGLPTGRIAWRAEDDGGQTVLDGHYAYALTARDVAGNSASTARVPLRVDRTPPVVSLVVSPALFSPNGDGTLDAASLLVRVEDAGPLEFWHVSIQPEAPGAKPARTFKGLDLPATAPLVWDGRSDERTPLPDGAYLVRLRAKDVMGNESATAPQGIVLGATRPQVKVSVSWDAFSPNADGLRDDATFSLVVSAFNPIQAWWLKIMDGQGAALRTFTGRGKPPAQVVWEGGRDDRKMLLDGDYQFLLEVTDEAGNRAATPAQRIRIDTTRPDLSAAVSPDLFSPNRDTFRDEATFLLSYRDASPCAAWHLEIRDEAKRVVVRFEGKGAPPISRAYDGRGKDGRVLPDGPYIWSVSAEDEVGNRATTPDQIFRVDTTSPQVRLTAAPVLISPDGDGERDTAAFYLEYKDASDIERWTLNITGRDPAAAKAFAGLGRPGTSLIWDGRGDGGSIVADGRYSAVLTLRDVVGNEGRSPAVSLTVDTAKPLIQVVAEEQPLTALGSQAPVKETAQGLVISLAAEVMFDTAKAEIKSTAHDTLMKAVNLLKKYPARKVRVEGHTDNMPIGTPQFPNNQALSVSRARSITRFFVETAGLPAERFVAEGYGDTRPVAANTTPEGRRQNRRVEITILKEGK